MSKVYLHGMISASTVYIIDDNFSYPKANEYAEIKKVLPSVGGEAVNSAIILSKCGVDTKLDGCWLNERTAPMVLKLLEPFRIDISRLKILPNHGTEEIVIADRETRTVFGNYATFHSGPKQWNDATKEDIQGTDYVSLDPYFKKEALDIARLCVELNKPYVTIDCCYDDYLAQNAESVIISHELRNQAYPDGNYEEIFNLYLNHCKGLVIFTFGSHDLWYARQGQSVKKFSPFKIKPIDTTGAGDSFRGGIVFGLLNKWSDEETVRFASAVAACVCLSIPHALNAPDLSGILNFIEKNS